EWTGLVHPGQFAVFHSDVSTDVEKTPEGHYLSPDEDSTCLVFDSLAEAESYCEAKVEAISNLRCDIYDHTGKSQPPVLTYVNRAHVQAPATRVIGAGRWWRPAYHCSGLSGTGTELWLFPWWLGSTWSLPGFAWFT